MIPGQFDYYRATSVNEALDLLETHADRDPELVAGGHGLVPSMKAGEASPGALVDIGGIDGLGSLEARGEEISVGALATHADLAASERLREHAMVLAEAATNVGDVQIRNRGTIGGNLAEANPAADLPAAVVAADATIRVRGLGGDRSIAAEEFFLGREATDLAESELITEIRVPPSGGGSGYVKKIHPATGYAMVGVAAVVRVDDGEVTDARVAANGVMEHAVRLTPVEDALVGTRAARADDSEAVSAAAEHASDDLDTEQLVEDVHASGAFRAHLLSTYTERALDVALARANGGERA